MDKDNPDSLGRTGADPSGIGALRDHAIGIIAFATVLALLYVGRDVLIPLALALMLSLLLAPLVRVAGTARSPGRVDPALSGAGFARRYDCRRAAGTRAT
jgi:hypothetical protein